jgi:hypothetical protein
MEIMFSDPAETPLPPSEARILALRAEPWPDGRRVFVEIETTPFQQRPNLHIVVYDSDGQEVASAGAMQIRERQIELTIHLRRAETKGQYQVSAYLAYADPGLGLVDQAQTTFEIP